MAMEWPTLTRPLARYFTSLEACSRPDYVYRRMRTGQQCKHQKALRQALELLAANEARWAERTP